MEPSQDPAEDLADHEVMCHPTDPRRTTHCGKKTRNSKKNYGFSFGFWNIHGLGKKVDDSDFISEIDGFDFFSLVETWHSGKVHFPNFLYFSSTRTKSKRARRNSGGIIFLFKKQYSKFITKLDSKSEDILWVKIGKGLLNTNRDTYLATVYISPNRSNIHNNRMYDIFDTLEDEISIYSRQGEVIIGGDFNARIGDLKDYIAGDYQIDSLPENYDFDHPFHRNNMDLGSPSPFGKNLIDLCINSKVRILNGRTPGDVLGKPTSYQPNGSSVVDYVLASETILLRKSCFFHVHPLTPLSDHCKLSLILNSNIRQLNEQTTDTLSARPHYKFEWSADSKERFTDIVNSTEFSRTIDSFNKRNYETSPS